MTIMYLENYDPIYSILFAFLQEASRFLQLLTKLKVHYVIGIVQFISFLHSSPHFFKLFNYGVLKLQLSAGKCQKNRNLRYILLKYLTPFSRAKFCILKFDRKSYWKILKFAASKVLISSNLNCVYGRYLACLSSTGEKSCPKIQMHVVPESFSNMSNLEAWQDKKWRN